MITKLIFNTLFILNVIHENKRVLNTERNNTYLAEASISPHFTTTCDFDKYTIIIAFWRKPSPKSLAEHSHIKQKETFYYLHEDLY